MNAVGSIQDVINFLTTHFDINDEIYITDNEIGSISIDNRQKIIKTGNFTINISDVPDLTTEKILLHSTTLCLIIPKEKKEKKV